MNRFDKKAKKKRKKSEKYIVSIAIQTTTAYNLLNIFDSSKIISKNYVFKTRC